MSNLEMRHPEEGLLLRYLDGELARGKANQIRSHLEACWQCRAEVEELQAAVGDSVRYRKTVGACLPPPPSPWRPLNFDLAEAELATQSVFSRLANFFSLRRNAPLRWAASAAAVLVLGAVILTGYLGGAIASYVRIGELYPPLVPLTTAMLAWLGIYLRDERLRELLPFRATPRK